MEFLHAAIPSALTEDRECQNCKVTMNRKRKINKFLSIIPHAPTPPLSHWKTVWRATADPEKGGEERRRGRAFKKAWELFGLVTRKIKSSLNLKILQIF